MLAAVGSVFLGSLVSAWPQIKQKSSAEGVCQNIEPRRGGAVWDCWAGFEKCWWVVVDVWSP